MLIGSEMELREEYRLWYG